MAIISKSGIGTGNTIQAEHITRIIDALNGTGSADIIATGSFTGSFNGSADIWTVQDLTVFGTASINYFETIYETSSVIYQSGSTKFGNSADDTHQFTGSIYVLGDTEFNGAVTASSLNLLRYYTEPSNTPASGSPTITGDQTGSIAIGEGAVAYTPFDAFGSIEPSVTIGYRAGSDHTDLEGGLRTVYIGPLAGRQGGRQNQLRVAIGENAGSETTFGRNQVLLGYQAGYQSDYSFNSIFIGESAGSAAISSSYSTGVGNQALYNVSNVKSAAALGSGAGYGADDSDLIVAVGSSALFQTQNSKYAIGIGGQAGWRADNVTSSIFLGYSAGYQADNSPYSIFIGNRVGYNQNTLGGDNIVIGNNIGLDSGAARTLSLGNVLYATGLITGSDSNTITTTPSVDGKVGIGKTTPNATLDVNGNTTITGSVDVANGNINLEDNAFFLQGTDTGGTNVSLIGVNSSDQIYIGNQGFTNIIADDTIISGSLNVTAGITGSYTGSFVGDGAGLYNIPASGITGLNLSQIASGSATASIAPNTGFRVNTDSAFTGSMTISGSASPALSVIGSGSAVFTVNGSVGEIFSVTDSLSGSLFAVNNSSGFAILDVNSDNTIQYGDPDTKAVTTTVKNTVSAAGVFTVYSLPTASYDGAWFEYVAKSGSDARAGQIMSLWSGTAVNFTETTTTDFGDTSGLSFTVAVSGSNFALTGSVATAGWTIKTIVRSI